VTEIRQLQWYCLQKSRVSTKQYIRSTLPVKMVNVQVCA
jgi:hypothetical protein